MSVRCPICSGSQFADYRGRSNERCATCGAKERTRMHHMMLSRMPKTRQDLPVYHIAPERPIAEKLISLFWTQYKPVDLFPAEYKSPVPVERFDLVADLSKLDTNSVGGFVHSHVLEHVRAPIEDIILEMNRVLAPGGFHFFCVPIGEKKFDEDYSNNLTDVDRLQRFGQEDHVRIFSRSDFEKRFIIPYFEGFKRIYIDELIALYEAGNAAIRSANVRRKPQQSTFLFIKE